MKKLLGVDVDGSAVLTPGAANSGLVTFTGLTLSLEQILIITNVTRNTIIYNFADTTTGAVSFVDNVLTLKLSTTSYSADDVLQVFVDVRGEVSPTLVDTPAQSGLTLLLARMLSILMAPLGYAKDLQRYRATTILESGTVTTCSTVTNTAQLGGLTADRLVLNQNYSAWSATHRARIT